MSTVRDTQSSMCDREFLCCRCPAQVSPWTSMCDGQFLVVVCAGSSRDIHWESHRVPCRGKLAPTVPNSPWTRNAAARIWNGNSGWNCMGGWNEGTHSIKKSSCSTSNSYFGICNDTALPLPLLREPKNWLSGGGGRKNVLQLQLLSVIARV